MGHLRLHRVLRLRRFRVAPIEGCFDFEHGVWDFDWSQPPPADGEAAKGRIWPRRVRQRRTPHRKRAVEERTTGPQGDPGIDKASKGIDINYKTLVWHYTHHVLRRKLIDGTRSDARREVRLRCRQEEAADRTANLPIALTVKESTTREDDVMALGTGCLSYGQSDRKVLLRAVRFSGGDTNEALEYMNRVVRPFGARQLAICSTKRDAELHHRTQPVGRRERQMDLRAARRPSPIRCAAD